MSNAKRKANARIARARGVERKERDKRVRKEHGAAGHQECGRKRRYATELDAVMGAMWAEQRGSPTLRVYKCRFCGGWHLTKRKRYRNGRFAEDG